MLSQLLELEKEGLNDELKSMEAMFALYGEKHKTFEEHMKIASDLKFKEALVVSVKKNQDVINELMQAIYNKQKHNRWAKKKRAEFKKDIIFKVEQDLEEGLIDLMKRMDIERFRKSIKKLNEEVKELAKRMEELSRIQNFLEMCVGGLIWFDLVKGKEEDKVERVKREEAK